MKQAKRPTRDQKKFLKTKGLDPESWLVVRDMQEYLEVVSRKELAACEMRRVEGVRKKPRIRKLEKVLIALLAAGTVVSTADGGAGRQRGRGHRNVGTDRRGI